VEDCISAAGGEAVWGGRRFCVRKMEPRDLLDWVEKRDFRVEKNWSSRGVSWKIFAFAFVQFCFLYFFQFGDTNTYLIVGEMPRGHFCRPS
jgi:hypothetical protein